MLIKIAARAMPTPLITLIEVSTAAMLLGIAMVVVGTPRWRPSRLALAAV